MSRTHCEFCKKSVNTKGFAEHLKTLTHKKNKDKANGIAPPPKNPDQFCHVCQKNVKKNGFKKHEQSKTHQKNLQKKTEQEEGDFEDEVDMSDNDVVDMINKHAKDQVEREAKKIEEMDRIDAETIEMLEKDPYDYLAVQDVLERLYPSRSDFFMRKHGGLLCHKLLTRLEEKDLKDSFNTFRYDPNSKNFHFKTLTEEEEEEIEKGPGYIEIKFYYMEERKHIDKKTGAISRMNHYDYGYGWAYCSQNTITYLYNLFMYLPIHPEFFDMLSNNEFNEQRSDFGVSDYDRWMKIIEIKRHKEHPSIPVEKIKLKASGDESQMTLGAFGGQYAKYGQIPYYRKNSCMLSFFMAKFKDKFPAKKRNDEMNFEFLYYLATGETLKEGEDAPVSLEQASKWADHFGIKIVAIDSKARKIFEKTPKVFNKKIQGGGVWRILVDHAHVWQISEESYKEVDQKKLKEYEEAYKQTQCETLEAKEPVNWNHPKKPDGKLPTFVQNLDDVYKFVEKADPEESMYTCITNDTETLAKECLKNNLKPGGIRLGNRTIIDSFNIRIMQNEKTKLVRIVKAMNHETTGDQIFNQQIGANQQHACQELLYKLRNTFTPPEMSSTLSTDMEFFLKSYPTRPLTGRMPGTKMEEKIAEFDITRAYTYYMSQITHIPKFTYFDRLTPMESVKNHPAFRYDTLDESKILKNPPDQSKEKIDPFSFYYILCPQLDHFLFQQPKDFRTGETLIVARENKIPFIMLGKISPQSTLKIDAAGAIKEVYDSDRINDAQKKSIVNISYGFTTKQYQKKDTAELEPNGLTFHRAFMRTFDENHTLIVHKKKQVLTENYLPVGKIILDKSRIYTYTINKLIGKYVRGFNVDAFHTSVEDKEIVYNILKQNNYLNKSNTLFGAIGTLKAPEVKMKVYTTFLMKEHEMKKGPKYYIPTKHTILKDEKKTMNKDDPNRWSEVDDILDYDPLEESGFVHIDATVPGAGKTYMIEEYCKRTYKKERVLFITPWNALASDIRKKLLQAMTLHNLCGKRVEYETVEEIMNKKKFNVTDYDHIHFDEICLYSPKELIWIYEFILYDKKDHTMITSTGDVGQLGAVNCGEFHTPKDDWYKMAIDTMFSKSILLQISKRLTNENEKERMYKMCNDLKDEFKSIGQILEEAKLPQMHFSELTAEDFQYPHITALQDTSAKVDNLASTLLNKPNNGNYEIGEELVGVKSYGCKGGKRISSSDSYIVEKIEEKETKGKETKEKLLHLMASDGTPRILPVLKAIEVLRRAYSRTCHSTQGMSLGDKIYVHDISSFMVNHCWVRTAITRCSTLNIVIVNGSKMNMPTTSKIEKKIKEHEEYDRKFKYDEKDYITPDWVKERLKKQRFQCWNSTCRKPIDDCWSIDRINNSKPHIKTNCALCCQKCQSVSSKRP
jgi:hypothetical protein